MSTNSGNRLVNGTNSGNRSSTHVRRVMSLALSAAFLIVGTVSPAHADPANGGRAAVEKPTGAMAKGMVDGAFAAEGSQSARQWFLVGAQSVTVSSAYSNNRLHFWSVDSSGQDAVIGRDENVALSN